MSNQTPFKILLDKVKQLIQGNQQMPKPPVHDQQYLKDHHAPLDIEEFIELPLEIGNELLITVDILKIVSGLSKNALGRVVIIDQLITNQTNSIKASAFGIQVTVDRKIAQRMRTAYLRREQAWT